MTNESDAPLRCKDMLANMLHTKPFSLFQSTCGHLILTDQMSTALHVLKTIWTILPER